MVRVEWDQVSDVEGAVGESDRSVVVGGEGVPSSGPAEAVEPVGLSGSAPDADPWAGPVADARLRRAALYRKTVRLWRQDRDGLIWPRPDWASCPVCSDEGLIVRAWQFHVRPGAPTVPWRCDVHLKCGECAAGWWHGVALPIEWWLRRPRPEGLRARLLRGSNFEPKIWNGVRQARDRRG